MQTIRVVRGRELARRVLNRAELSSDHFSPATASSMHAPGCPTLPFRRGASCPRSSQSWYYFLFNGARGNTAVALAGFGGRKELPAPLYVIILPPSVPWIFSI